MKPTTSIRKLAEEAGIPREKANRLLSMALTAMIRGEVVKIGPLGLFWIEDEPRKGYRFDRPDGSMATIKPIRFVRWKAPKGFHRRMSDAYNAHELETA